MGLESLFKRFLDGVDVIYNLLSVPIGGVFAFDELELYFSLVGRVFDDFTVGPSAYPTALMRSRCGVSVYCVPEGCIPVQCALVPLCLVCRLAGPLDLVAGLIGGGRRSFLQYQCYVC